MVVVSIRIPSLMLHMPNKRFVPIDDIKRTIRCRFDIHGTKVWIAGVDHVLSQFARIPGSVLPDLVLLYSQETNGVTDKKVSLYVIREMPRIHKFGP